MELAAKLRTLLGHDVVADDAEALAVHAGDKWFAAHPPEVVVFAKSTADVSKLLQFASCEKIPVTARGGGFGYVGGCVPARGGIALSLMRMNRIKEINFADAVAVVEPGVFTAELKAAVRAKNAPCSALKRSKNFLVILSTSNALRARRVTSTRVRLSWFSVKWKRSGLG